MGVMISGIEPGSIAQRAGLSPQHTLLAVNGHPITDVLDYRFYMMEPHLDLELLAPTGERYRKTVRKAQYDDLGLEFESYLMDEQRFCRNKCVFCFIDQLPAGLRETLYFKDDDSRMSFLFGNYITLTNLQDKDIERILEMHISPVNISVHTTNPALRVQMMANPRAGEVLAYIPRLTQAGIKVNAQLVLCPGINDGTELVRSLDDLCALAPNLQSIAVVPVGLTKHRQKLTTLRLFTAQESRAVIELVNKYGDKMLALHNQRTCFAADEFYLNAGLDFPPYGHYESFDQLENGVGLLPLLIYNFAQALADEPPRTLRRSVTIATGQAAHAAITAIAQDAQSKFPGLRVQVIAIRNDFFGQDITVAGLLTGADILAQLDGIDLGDALLLPATTLRHERDLFLDGISLDHLRATLPTPVRTVENDGYDLLCALLGEE